LRNSSTFFCNGVEHIGVIATSSTFSSIPYKHLRTNKFKIHSRLQGMCQFVHSLNDMFNIINIKVWAYESRIRYKYLGPKSILNESFWWMSLMHSMYKIQMVGN
jgi:hypothetical protein